ncbi:hypothetical protein [Kitasatospora sp. NPDC001095]
MGEGFDVVGLQDDLDGVVSGGVSCDLGRGDGGGGGVDGGGELGRTERVLLQEAVCGGDLDGRGIHTVQEDGLLGSLGQVAEFGALHGGELGRGLGEDGLGEVGVVEFVEGPADAVRGLDQAAVGDDHRAAAGEVRLGDRARDLAEGLAFLLAAPALSVGLQGAGGAGRVGVGAPQGVGQLGERSGQAQKRGGADLGGEGGDAGGEVAFARSPGADQLVSCGVDAVAGHGTVPSLSTAALPG